MVGAVAAAVVGACVAVIASFAVAHPAVFPNQVTLTKAYRATGNIAVYKGRVRSVRRACTKRREVQVYNATANPDVRVATTRSNRSGRWKVEGARVSNGEEVYALIETKVLKRPGHNHTCAVDQSPMGNFHGGEQIELVTDDR